MKEYLYEQFYRLTGQIIQLDSQVIAYVILLVIVIIVLDDVLRALKQKKESSGILHSKQRAISIDGAPKHKARTYVSEIQGIAGRPDAVIIENGFFIPVERKPLSNKVRDRYIAQLLVYMRLIEEFEGKKPPYGYLVVGKNSRKVKINNTEEKQEWLTTHLEKMREIVEKDVAPVALPQKNKCKKCKVRDNCDERWTNPY